jgi:hypothetical protein
MIKFQQIEKLWLNSYIYGRIEMALNICFAMEFNEWNTQTRTKHLQYYKNNTMYKQNQWKKIAYKKTNVSSYRLKQHKKT